MISFKLIILLLSFAITIHSEKLDYYWRDYLGEKISPEDDALPGGTDKTLGTTYIAQVFIPNHGILPTRLYEGQTSVTASRVGVHNSDVFIQVLCSDKPDKLTWVPTTAATIGNDTLGKHLVNGGTENGKILNIGRVSYQGEVIIGKVCTYDVGNAQLYFPYHGEEVVAASYEVLTYANVY